jgi:hypothetical protein
MAGRSLEAIFQKSGVAGIAKIHMAAEPGHYQRNAGCDGFGGGKIIPFAAGWEYDCIRGLIEPLQIF